MDFDPTYFPQDPFQRIVSDGYETLSRTFGSDVARATSNNIVGAPSIDGGAARMHDAARDASVLQRIMDDAWFHDRILLDPKPVSEKVQTSTVITHEHVAQPESRLPAHMIKFYQESQARQERAIELAGLEPEAQRAHIELKAKAEELAGLDLTMKNVDYSCILSDKESGTLKCACVVMLKKLEPDEETRKVTNKFRLNQYIQRPINVLVVGLKHYFEINIYINNSIVNLE